ncbi:NADPH-dependent FMN reductase [Kitasatospora fiedleri]|uniref:NADPH-dependent FMN reductase n=1 Tax=Kitasatospora fiedleri TaxID=2991545 RepID=UPI00249B8DB3|nr:NADPH-dependent FMN reductase [Kitasatospora fiedleri]
MGTLILMGSERVDSYTAALSRAIADALESAGADTETVPAGDPAAADQAGLRERIARAEAVVLVSPVYHGGYSALLKAVLDRLPGDAFVDKPVAVAAHGSGPRTGNVVCDQLRTVARAMGAWVVPTQVAGCPDDFHAVGGAPTGPDAELADRCVLVAGELLRLGAAFRAPAGV